MVSDNSGLTALATSLDHQDFNTPIIPLYNLSPGAIMPSSIESVKSNILIEAEFCPPDARSGKIKII